MYDHGSMIMDMGAQVRHRYCEGNDKGCAIYRHIQKLITLVAFSNSETRVGTFCAQLCLRKGMPSFGLYHALRLFCHTIPFGTQNVVILQQETMECIVIMHMHFTWHKGGQVGTFRHLAPHSSSVRVA